MTHARGWTIAISSILMAIAVTGCGGSEASDPSSAREQSPPALDCALARSAMGDYSVALTSLAQALDADDRMASIAAANALTYSASEVVSALPGAPESAQEFARASDDVAVLIKQAMADQVPFATVINQVTTAFAGEGFTIGGDALDDYADQVCPEPDATP